MACFITVFTAFTGQNFFPTIFTSESIGLHAPHNIGFYIYLMDIFLYRYIPHILMEKRNLVKSGNTSYTLSLPIDWIRKNKLERGSPVNVFENESGEVVISAEKKEDFLQTQEYKTIEIDGKSVQNIRSELLDAYLHDFSTIILEGKEIRTKTEPLLSLLNYFIGLDSIEQTTNSIVIKNFSSLDKETSSHSLIRKLDMGIRTMVELLGEFFSKGFKKEDLFELKKQHEHNERIYILARKIILKITENPALMRNFQTSYHQLSKDKIVVSSMKQISFILLSCGKVLLYLDKSKKETKMLQEVFNTIREEYITVLDALKHRKLDDAYKFLNQSSSYNEKLESYLKEAKNPLIAELINYAIFINTTLNQLAFEAVE